MLNCVQSCLPDTFCLAYINHCLSTSRKRDSSPEDWEISHTCVEKNCGEIRTFICFLVQKLWQLASDVLTQLLQIMTVQSHPWPRFTSSLLSHSRSALSPLWNHFHCRKPKETLGVNEVCNMSVLSPWAFVMFSVAFGFRTRKSFVQNKGGIFNGNKVKCVCKWTPLEVKHLIFFLLT